MFNVHYSQGALSCSAIANDAQFWDFKLKSPGKVQHTCTFLQYGLVEVRRGLATLKHMFTRAWLHIPLMHRRSGERTWLFWVKIFVDDKICVISMLSRSQILGLWQKCSLAKEFYPFLHDTNMSSNTINWGSGIHTWLLNSLELLLWCRKFADAGFWQRAKNWILKEMVLFIFDREIVQAFETDKAADEMNWTGS